MRKSSFCLENKDSDKLHNNCATIQHISVHNPKHHSIFCDLIIQFMLSLVLKPLDRFFRIAAQLCQNKGTNKLCNTCTADQLISLRYMDSTFSLLPNFYLIFCGSTPSGLCQALSKTPKRGSLALRLNYDKDKLRKSAFAYVKIKMQICAFVFAPCMLHSLSS